MKSQSGSYNNKNVLDFEYVTIIVCCSNSSKKTRGATRSQSRNSYVAYISPFLSVYRSVGRGINSMFFNVFVLLRQAFGDHLTDQLLKLQAIR